MLGKSFRSNGGGRSLEVGRLLAGPGFGMLRMSLLSVALQAIRLYTVCAKKKRHFYSAVALRVFHSTSSFSSSRIWLSTSPILRCWRSMTSCNCRYALLPLDNSWSAEIRLSRSSKGDDNMFYREKKQSCDSGAHITGSLTRGLESDDMFKFCV